MQSLKPPTHPQPLQTPMLRSSCLIPPSKLPNLSPFLTTLIFLWWHGWEVFTSPMLKLAPSTLPNPHGS